MVQDSMDKLIEGNWELEIQVCNKGAKPQKLEKGIANYWTKEQLEKLADPEVPFNDKKLMVHELFVKLGIFSLDEQTVKWAVAWMLYWLFQTTKDWPHLN